MKVFAVLLVVALILADVDARKKKRNKRKKNLYNQPLAPYVLPKLPDISPGKACIHTDTVTTGKCYASQLDLNNAQDLVDGRVTMVRDIEGTGKTYVEATLFGIESNQPDPSITGSAPAAYVAAIFPLPCEVNSAGTYPYQHYVHSGFTDFVQTNTYNLPVDLLGRTGLHVFAENVLDTATATAFNAIFGTTTTSTNTNGIQDDELPFNTIQADVGAAPVNGIVEVQMMHPYIADETAQSFVLYYFADAAGGAGTAGVSPTPPFDLTAAIAEATNEPTFELAESTDVITKVLCCNLQGKQEKAPKKSKKVEKKQPKKESV